MRAFALIAGLIPLLLGAPAAAGVDHTHLQVLERRIIDTAAQNSGDYGMAVMDLETGVVVGVNGNRAYPMASTVKIAVAAAYLNQVDLGIRKLDDGIGTSTAYALMERMMIHSDNGATDQLIRALGGPVIVNAWLQSNGIAGVRMDRTIAQLLAARRDLYEQYDSATPIGMLTMLRKIDKGEVLRPASREVLLDMMRRCATGRNRIRGMMPTDAVVEHKTGTLNNYSSDVGFITTPNGNRVAVVFFARGGANRPAVIATAARAIYDTFSIPTRTIAPIQIAEAVPPSGELTPVRPPAQVGDGRVYTSATYSGAPQER